MQLFTEIPTNAEFAPLGGKRSRTLVGCDAPWATGEWEGSVGAFTYGKRAGSYVVPAKKHWFGLQVGEVNEDDGVTA